MKRYLGIGFAAWLLATIAIRFGGAGIIPEGGVGLAVVFAAAALVIGAAISYLVRQIPDRDAGLRAAVGLVLPGLLLDTGSVLWFPALFPNLPASAGMPFAALLLWAYGIALLAALLPRKSLNRI